MIKDIKEINFPEYATLSQATVNIADMGERSITTNIKISGDIVPDFSYDWEVEHKGERYIHTARQPQASKENTSRRTSIDLTFKHWAIVELQRYYFVEMASTEAGTAVPNKYIVPINLNLGQFVNLLNQVLAYYYGGTIQAVLNPAWVYDENVTNISLNYTYIWDLLQKVYELYGVRWTIESDNNPQDNLLLEDGGDLLLEDGGLIFSEQNTGKKRCLIKFGFDAPEASHIFEYGYKGGLLKVERQVQSSDIKNILLGRGGDKNLPYLYFKDYDKYGAGTSEDTGGSSETKTIEGVTAPAISSLGKNKKASIKATYTGTFEVAEGKSGVLMASVPTATGYYLENHAPKYIPANRKYFWDEKKDIKVVFISLGSPNIQVYNSETKEQVSQVAIPSGKYYYVWENEVANSYTDTLHDIVVTLPSLTLIVGSGTVIGASLTGNRGFRPDPDAIPELKDIAFTELRSSEFREYVQGWKAAHYDGAIPEEQSEAFIKGITDEKFNPVEYVKDEESIEKYGELWGALDNNEDIYPSIQNSGFDDVIDVEQIQTDAVDNSDLFAFTEDINIPQRATYLVIEPFSTVEYSFYVEGSEKLQYDDYKNSVSLSSYELEAKDLSNQQNVGADSFEVIEKKIQVLTTAFDWGKIRVTLNITNNSDKRVSVVKFLGRLKVYYRLNGTTDEVGNALWTTAFHDYAPTKTGSQSKLIRSATLYCYGSNTKQVIIHIPDGYVGILPKCTLGDTKIRRYYNVSTENLVYEVKFKNAVFIDTTNENNTYDFADENDIPAGDYYIKYTYEYSVTNVPNNKSWELSQGISLSLTLKAEHPELLKSPYTFDIWVKNLWDTEKREDETDKQYAERVWFPIIGQNDAEITFTSGLLAISSDYQFKIAKGGINYDTSKEHNGEQSHWRLTLQKSDAEYEATGLYIPNTRINAKAGDKFFFTNIELPHQYILWAEKKLHDYKVDNLEEVSEIKPTWAVSLDKVRCNNADSGDVKKLIDQIEVGSLLRIAHSFITDTPYNSLYVQSATYTYNEPSEENPCIYPDVEIVLSDTVTTVTSPVALMQSEIDALRYQIGGSLSNIEQAVQAVGNRLYLRKDGINDVEAGYVEFQQGARFNGQTDFKDDVIIGKDGYAGGITGFGMRLGKNGDAEMESLVLRSFLEVPELRYNRTDITLGNAWRAVSAGIVETVIPDIDDDGSSQLNSGVVYLKLEDGEIGSVAVDDICMGIFHDDNSLENNALADSDDGIGNFNFAGFSTVYFRVTELLDDSRNSAFRYVLRPIDDTWGQQYHPQAGMTFCGYGNFTNTERQTSKYETRTYERYLKDVNTWTFSAGNIAAQFGDLSNLSIFDIDMTGYSAYLNNIYMTGRIKQLTPSGEEIPTINDRGVWNSDETYNKNDDVYHNDSKWRCITDGTTSEPSENNPAWLLLAKSNDGLILRQSEWAVGVEYHNDKDATGEPRYLDVVLVSNNATATGWDMYICNATHVSSSSNAPTTSSEYWSPANTLAPIITPIVFAKNSSIKFMQGNRLLVQDENNEVVAGLVGDEIPLFLGSTFEERDNAPFRVNKAGQALAKDITINGSFRSSVGYWNGTNKEVFQGDSNGFGRVDNIVLPTNREVISADQFSWNISETGRLIRLINYIWGNQVSTGRTILEAADGCYFYENGEKNSKLIMSRELVELLGYGDNETFYGWIVLNRIDIGTTYHYGSQKKILLAGTIRCEGKNISLENFWSYRMAIDAIEDSISIEKIDNSIAVKYDIIGLNDNRVAVTLQTLNIPFAPSQTTDPLTNVATYAAVNYVDYSTFVYTPYSGTAQAANSCVYFEVYSTADFTTNISSSHAVAMLSLPADNVENSVADVEDNVIVNFTAKRKTSID